MNSLFIMQNITQQNGQNMSALLAWFDMFHKCSKQKNNSLNKYKWISYHICICFICNTMGIFVELHCKVYEFCDEVIGTYIDHYESITIL